MEYRKLPHGEEQISVIGLGNSSLTSQVGGEGNSSHGGDGPGKRRQLL